MEKYITEYREVIRQHGEEERKLRFLQVGVFEIHTKIMPCLFLER